MRGQHVPVYLVFQPQLTDRQDLRVHVLSSQVAGLPLPGLVGDRLGQSIPRTLALPSLRGVQKVQVRSKPGQGSIFTLALPAAEAQSSSPSSS